MRTTQTTQRERTQNNPLNMGQFNQLAIRNLKGSLGPKNQVIGGRDTNQLSYGGYGGGSYNHWFKFTIESEAWIIIAKNGTRPKYINTSVYDLNLNPIEGRGIFQADSISTTVDGKTYYPYLGHMMAAQSNLYNFFDPNRLDRGDDRYYPLPSGSYLLCISTTRNEPLTYEVAVVLEFVTADFNLVFEDFSMLFLENYDQIENDHTENYQEQDLHAHSLSEWQEAWEREHQADDRFPSVLVPLTTVP